MRRPSQPEMPVGRSSGFGEFMGRGDGGSKNVAQVRFDDGSVRRAEIHRYEATGIGRKEFKIKYFLD